MKITTGQAAVLLNVGQGTVLNYVKRFGLPAVQVNRGLRKQYEFEFEDVQAFAERNLLAFDFIRFLELYNPKVEEDRLFSAIVWYLNSNKDRELVDLSAKDLVKVLREAGAQVPEMGGKAIAYHLREIQTKLAAANIALTECEKLQRPRFTLRLKT